MSAKRVYFDTLRTLAFGGISATYAAVGVLFAFSPRMVYITNDTDAGMIFTDDNTVAAGKIYVPAHTTLSFNFTANMIPGQDDSFVMAKGTIMYVKQASAPTSGSVNISLVHAGF